MCGKLFGKQNDLSSQEPSNLCALLISLIRMMQIYLISEKKYSMNMPNLITVQFIIMIECDYHDL